MAESVFNIAAAISYIKRFTNTVVFGKTGVAIESTATKPVFFCKLPLSSSHTFLVEMTDNQNAKIGSIMFALTTGKHSYGDSGITVLGASSQEIISQTKILVSSNFEDPEDLTHVLVGLKLGTYGTIKFTYQVLSSSRAIVTPIALSREISTDYKLYDVSKGYLLDRALFEETDTLNAFRKWSNTFQYSANDPVFYGSHLYYASPNNLPSRGEDPVHYPSKWIELATADIPDTDISKGAKTPQLFYDKSLVITNDTAAGLRKARKDVGYQYPSVNSKVYHFDNDLLDQFQENSLENNIEVDADPEIPPFFVGKGMVGVGISSDPAISFKPLKEIPAFYYGNFGLRKSLTLTSGNNLFAFHFKYSGVQNLVNEHILVLTFPSGERIHLVANYSEIDYNSDPTMTYWDTEDNPVYSEREVVTSALTVLSYNGAMIAKTEVFRDYPLVEDSWAHLCVKIGFDSVTIFFRGQQVTIPRQTDGFGNVEYLVNRSHRAFSIDELIWDTTASIPFSRYIELSTESLPWAEHEKNENWFLVSVADPEKFDTNMFDSPVFKEKVRDIFYYENSCVTERSLLKVLGTNDVLEAFQILKAKSDAENFEGLGLGDYIDIPNFSIGVTRYDNNPAYENLRIQIVGFNLFKSYYNAEPHIVFMFKNGIFKKVMFNDIDDFTYYVQSDLHNYLSTRLDPALESAMGIPIKSVSHWFHSSASEKQRATVKCYIPTEIELCGFNGVDTMSAHGAAGTSQFPYFALKPGALQKNFNGVTTSYWTSSPNFNSASSFAVYDRSGYLDFDVASDTRYAAIPALCL